MFQTLYEVQCHSIKLFPNYPNFCLFRMKRGNKDDVVLFSFGLQMLYIQILFNIKNTPYANENRILLMGIVLNGGGGGGTYI